MAPACLCGRCSRCRVPATSIRVRSGTAPGSLRPLSLRTEASLPIAAYSVFQLLFSLLINSRSQAVLIDPGQFSRHSKIPAEHQMCSKTTTLQSLIIYFTELEQLFREYTVFVCHVASGECLDDCFAEVFRISDCLAAAQFTYYFASDVVR